MWAVPSDPVLTIEPATADVLGQHPGAKRMLVEHYQGHDYIVTTDDQCRFGIERAARAWAEATGAAYREAS